MSTTYFFQDFDPVQTRTLNRRECWMPKGDVPYFDKTMNTRFESRAHKRRVMAAWGMREAGETLKPSKGLGGTEGAMTRSKARRIV